MDNNDGVIATVEALKDADLGAGKPVAKPKPTSKEIGEMRSRYMTVRHDTVIACGHKLDVHHFPSNSNCENCWMAFFESNAEGVGSVHTLLMTDGTRAVEAVHSKKFVKYFGRFLRNKLLLGHQEKQAAETAVGTLGSPVDVNAERIVADGLR